MSGKRKDAIQLERSFLLRLPEHQSEMVAKALNAGFVKDYLSIEFQADYRHATVRVGKSALSGKLTDTPTIMESFKTIDKKSFYKTADICQVLICSEEDDDVNIDVEEANHKIENKFLFNHGVTPPLKNVRKRRFRKTARQKHQECPEVKKELERLLRADVQAESVTFEVLVDEEKGEEKPSSVISLAARNDLQDDLQEDHLAFLQEPISDEDDDLDIESAHKESRKSDFDEREKDNVGYTEKEKELNVLSGANNVIAEQCAELRLKSEEQKSRIERAENPFLKQRLQSTLDNLQQQLKDKEKMME